MKKDTGLVISGGGANGLFAVSLLRLLQLDYSKIGHIAGVSVGSIIGAMIAQGDESKVFDVFNNLQNKQVYSGKFTVWSGIKNRILGRNYVLDIEPLYGLLKKYISLEKAQNSDIIFHIGVVDFESASYKSFTQFDFDDESEYIRAIMASCSQPIIWKNITFRTKTETIKCGYDGGIIHVSPISDLVRIQEVEKLIIINNSPDVIEPAGDLSKTEGVLLRMIDILVNASYRKDLAYFQEINRIVEQKGEYENRRYIPAKLYQFEEHLNGLDFQSEELREKRVNAARLSFDRIIHFLSLWFI